MLNPPKRLMLGLMLIFALLDQLSKLLALGLLPPEASVPVIPGIFQLTLAYNTGAAFSLLQHRPQLLTLTSSVIFLTLLACSFSRRQLLKGDAIALGMILGGALGNLVDRFRLGQVTDFLDVVAIHYPIFNVADSLIVCGVALLTIRYLVPAPHEHRRPSLPPAAETTAKQH